MAAILLETIRIEEGKAKNLPYHQARFDKSRRALFNATSPLALQKYIDPPQNGLYRCRILYTDNIESVEYLSYTPKTINTLRVVTDNTLEYHYKYADRSALNSLLSAHPNADEIIIEQNGLLTDTTIANIAFYNGSRWLTPATPLLEGTMRANLLDQGILQTTDIRKADLHRYTHVALMNAMIGFKILKKVTII